MYEILIVLGKMKNETHNFSMYLFIYIFNYVYVLSTSF